MTRNTSNVKTKEMFARDLNIARMNILLATIVTLVNVILVIANSDMFFFFTLSVPVYLPMIFSELCGMRPDAFYEEFYGAGWENTQFINSSVFWVVVAVSVIIVAFVALLWYLSKKSKVWSVVNLVIYVLDILGLLAFSLALYGFSMNTLLELVFHAWLIYYAVLAVKAWNGMETAPTAAEVAARAGYGPSPYGSPYAPIQEEPIVLSEDAVTEVNDENSENEGTEATVVPESNSEEPVVTETENDPPKAE